MVNKLTSSFIGAIIGGLGFYCYNKYNDKYKKTNNSINTNSSYAYIILNLTPDTINLYDSNNNLLYGIEPEEPEYQLRLCGDEHNTSSNSITIVSKNYKLYTDIEFEYMKQQQIDIFSNNFHDDVDNHISSLFPINTLNKYTHIEGIDELRTRNYYSIIVSKIIGEYLIKHSDKYKGLCHHVLVPNTEPNSIVCDTYGQILGIRSFIDYGSLSE